MALFSQDLFEVFDEKSEPVSLSGKKRKRSDAVGGKKPEEEQKRFKADAQGHSTRPAAASSGEGTSSVIDLTLDENDAKDETV